ncbi:MAG: DUF4215 domain-containing protein [Candidatus Aenigmarchaeota archaeon]|nr:DUF4215 domain-containing protein [Candidatus Aenigmarchaeota archaeon]
MRKRKIIIPVFIALLVSIVAVSATIENGEELEAEILAFGDDMDLLQQALHYSCLGASEDSRLGEPTTFVRGYGFPEWESYIQSNCHTTRLDRGWTYSFWTLRYFPSEGYMNIWRPLSGDSFYYDVTFPSLMDALPTDGLIRTKGDLGKAIDAFSGTETELLESLEETCLNPVETPGTTNPRFVYNNRTWGQYFWCKGERDSDGSTVGLFNGMYIYEPRKARTQMSAGIWLNGVFKPLEGYVPPQPEPEPEPEPEPFCGDEIVNLEEECDSGVSNGEVPAAPYDGSVEYCSEICTLEIELGNYCGDSELDNTEGEECDSGIGNGVECIPGYGDSCTYCTNSCIIEEERGPYCGDGILAEAYGEQCDDGNTEVEDGCDNYCQIEIPQPICPEGFGFDEFSCGCYVLE